MGALLSTSSISSPWKPLSAAVVSLLKCSSIISDPNPCPRQLLVLFSGAEGIATHTCCVVSPICTNDSTARAVSRSLC